MLSRYEKLLREANHELARKERVIAELAEECGRLKRGNAELHESGIKRHLRRMIGSLRKRTVDLLVEKCWMQMGEFRQYPARSLRHEKFPKPCMACGELPSISMVTPSFMQARYLERTMESILSQDYPALSYVVQDGGSTDGSVEIIKRHASRLTGWESSPDGGQAMAIRSGFGKCNGEIMGWLNSDDTLMPGALRYVAEYFAMHPMVDAVYGHRIIIDHNDREVGRWILPQHDGEILKWADYIPQESLFWRRELWDKVGGLDPDFQFAMDWDLLLKFENEGANIVRLPYFIGCFRTHMMQKTFAEMTNSTGEKEMRQIRETIHGRKVNHRDLMPHMRQYYAKAVATTFLLSMGIRV